MRVSGKCKKHDKTYCAETRDYSELMPTSSPDLNQGPSDLQSDALPTELSRQLMSKSRNKLTRTKIAHFLQELLMFNTMISGRQCV